MVKVCVIGSGNVSVHLIKAFQESRSAELVQVLARSEANLSGFVADTMIISDYSQLKDADLYVIAVSDSAIGEVSAQLTFENRLVAHTSGAMDLTLIDPRNRPASFYPLQTFSKAKAIDMRSVPICIEATDKADLEVLHLAASAISDRVYEMQSAQRRAAHLAAVFASNFTNHMYAIADEICTENKVNFEILKPLIRETAEKVMHLSPLEAQTGPALRNDTESIKKHLELLSDSDLKTIYSILSKSIHAKKL
ncbi:MAG: DUF2520 domain-containing protein [Flavobacterium sp.]|nr:DUF2520 domain-containing protein [Flavobacterium sp.]